MPYIVRQCVEEVEKRGIEEVGIYRISGVATDIQALKAVFDASESGRPSPVAVGRGCSSRLAEVVGEPSGIGRAFSVQRPRVANGRGALVCELQSSGRGVHLFRVPVARAHPAFSHVTPNPLSIATDKETGSERPSHLPRITHLVDFEPDLNSDLSDSRV